MALWSSDTALLFLPGLVMVLVKRQVIAPGNPLDAGSNMGKRVRLTRTHVQEYLP